MLVKEADQVSHLNLLATSGDFKDALPNQHSLVLILYKGLLTETNQAVSIPLTIETLLQDYRDVFPEDSPVGLPPIRGIEHQIDLVPGATLPNCPAYMTNPVETKELQKKINDQEPQPLCCTSTTGSKEGWKLADVC